MDFHVKLFQFTRTVDYYFTYLALTYLPSAAHRLSFPDAQLNMKINQKRKRLLTRAEHVVLARQPIRKNLPNPGK